ncbi:MAG: ATP synthase F0 subunit B [Deltaproteobacteria bacterium]|nr:ATP synthase F0 subunit B [Deltaproteobacteria bacterium]
MTPAFLTSLLDATQTVALGVAAPQAAESQLLDVDGTVFVMLGLFLVMLAVLTPLLWKPYLKIKAERSTRVDGYRAEAEKMALNAQAQFDKVEKELAAARREGAGSLAVARSEAQAREQTVLAEAHAKARAVLTEAKAKLDAALAAQKANLNQRAESLGREAASKVLGRSVS